MIIDKLTDENYKVVTRPARPYGTSSMINLPSALEDVEVYVLIKTKPKRSGGSNCKVILPKYCLNEEIEVIIPNNLNYKTIYIDNKRKVN